MEVVIAEIEPGYRRHLVLTGEAIRPRDCAGARGIVDELVPASDLLQRALGLARARAAAPAYRTVKEQLRRETLARMRKTVSTSSDPMLERWI